MNTKKFFVYGLIAIIFALAFFACDDGSGKIHTHQWGAWTQTIAPTCTTAGEETRTCTLDPTHTETRTAYATGTAGLAFDLISNNTAYRVHKGTATSASTIHIPAYRLYNGNYLPVTEIGDTSYPFPSDGVFFNTGITTVTFAENSLLERIGRYAFSNCTGLTSITIPASVTFVGLYAFRDWTASQTINVPFANASAKPSGWDTNWNNSNAVIKYWNGSSYQ